VKLFTSQEKTVFRFLIGTALAGLIVGAIRHNYFDSKRDNIVTHERKASFLRDSQLPLDTDAVSVLQEIVADGQEEALREGSIKKKIEIINVNTAKKDELIILPNVGPVTAERIIRFREDFGVFKSIDDLTRVKGIGPKTLDKLRKYVTI
jgi:comEA protein